MAKSKDDSRRKYRTEDLARSAAIYGLSDKFDIFEQVNLMGLDDNAMRIDAVARCLDTGWMIGLEFKKSHLFMSEFSKAIRQAIHYRISEINDKRFPEYIGCRLPAIALFPDWLGEHDDDVTSYLKESEGMRIVAEKFRVGTMREMNKGRISFIMGQAAIWHSSTGWTKNAESVLFGDIGFASVRKKDNRINPILPEYY
ncbi:hypothetical protein [Rhodospirillum sp. A1_3_36]|uniref:hypothetical protein n=1 Tax=Rhodospirillum sp. A1_3_36 TaxID=3391666 RepID=UPI0039A48418